MAIDYNTWIQPLVDLGHTDAEILAIMYPPNPNHWDYECKDDSRQTAAQADDSIELWWKDDADPDKGNKQSQLFFEGLNNYKTPGHPAWDSRAQGWIDNFYLQGSDLSANRVNASLLSIAQMGIAELDNKTCKAVANMGIWQVSRWHAANDAYTRKYSHDYLTFPAMTQADIDASRHEETVRRLDADYVHEYNESLAPLIAAGDRPGLAAAMRNSATVIESIADPAPNE